MKGIQAILPLAAVAAAFVIPDDAVMNEVNLERDSRDIFDRLASPQELLGDAQDKFSNVVEVSHKAFDNAVYSIKDTFETAAGEFEDAKAEVLGGGHHKPHRPHHPHHPHETNLTLYQLITKSKYTTKFAELVNNFDEAVDFFNKTSANVTLFVPTDKAFERIPDHGHKPSRDLLATVLGYHTVHDIYSARGVFGVHTLAADLYGKNLSEKPETTPQRISVKLGFTGLFLNAYARVVYPNVFGTNGVIHAIDHILIPPPRISALIKSAPQAFSTFSLAAAKTGFHSGDHKGATIFVSPNHAWAKLGPRVNAFLFSDYGTKYLKAILAYHIVLNQTLYSDAYYPNDDSSAVNVPKGLFHVELPTLLEGKPLAIDIARYGRFIELKVNAFTRAEFQDGVAQDGVFHVTDNVLIPPKKLGETEMHYNGEELTVEDLKERLEPFVSHDETETEGSVEL